MPLLDRPRRLATRLTRRLRGHLSTTVGFHRESVAYTYLKGSGIDLEHCPNPLLALDNMFRVLRDRGAPLAHIVRDYDEGPEWSMRAHFEEWSRLVNHRGESGVDQEVRHPMAAAYSIHFHVWTPSSLLELLAFLRQRLPFDIELFYRRKDEVIVVLRKLTAEQA